MKNSVKAQKLNFIDVFAGAGGLSCGLELAGLRCILGIDADRHAMDTFKQNHKDAAIFCGDVTKLTPKVLTELIGDQVVDVVVGGPPCQGFSTVGLGDPEDMRNKLFMQFVRLVKLTKPNFVVIENVTGMLAKKNEKTLKAIFKKFEALGFHMDVQVMSSQNYGVPEKRRRTILLGSRLNVPITFPSPTHDITLKNVNKPAVSVGEALSDLNDKTGSVHNHDLAQAQVKSSLELKRLKCVPEGRGIRYKKDELAFLPKSLRLGVDWDQMRENRFRQAKYQRLDRKLPSPTIMTHRHSYYHPTEHRYLTQREAAKIQSFPNDFIFKGPLCAQWRQIGNAVPPLMARAIGKELLKMHQLNFASTGLKTKKEKKAIDDSILNYRKKAFVYREPESQSA